MAPGRERAEAGDALAVGVDVGAAAHIVPVRTAAAQDDEVEAVGLGVDALGPVLHDGKPPAGRSRVLREQHLRVSGQPVEPLVRVDDLAALRLIGSIQAAKAGYSRSHTPIMLSTTPAASQSLPRTMLSLPPLQA